MTKEVSERKINLGNGYTLCNDPYCYWITKDYVYESGKNKGKVYSKNITGYHSTIENAFFRLSEYHTRQFDTKSINMLIREVRRLKQTISDLIKEIDNG